MKYKISYIYRYAMQRIYALSGYKTYQAFSYFALDRILGDHYKKWDFVPFNYYEFGTGEGNSLKYFLKSLKVISKQNKIDIKKFNIFLFDSFEGLPEYDDRKDLNPAWSRGQFKGSLDSIKSIVKEIAPEVMERTKFIKGFYENTLTADLRKELNGYPPSLVNVDVDYYKSAKTVIEWIYPICQDGTIFYFDDIFEYLGNLSKGEYRAIKEFNRDHLKEGFRFYPFDNLGIPSYTGKIFTLNKIENESY